MRTRGWVILALICLLVVALSFSAIISLTKGDSFKVFLWTLGGLLASVLFGFFSFVAGLKWGIGKPINRDSVDSIMTLKGKEWQLEDANYGIGGGLILLRDIRTENDLVLVSRDVLGKNQEPALGNHLKLKKRAGAWSLVVVSKETE